MKAPVLGRWAAIGMARAFGQGRIEWLDDVRERHGDVVRIPAPVGRYVVFAPHVMRQVLHDHRRFHKGVNYRELEYVMGRSLVTSDGARWVEQRRSVGKLFQQEAARRQVGSATRVARAWAERLSRHGSGQAFDLTRAVGELTCAVTCDLLFGPVRQRDVRALYDWGVVASEVLLARIHAPLRLPRWVPTRAQRAEAEARRHIDAFINTRIERALSDLDLTPTHSFLEAALLTLGERIAEPACRAELRDHLVTLLRAGQDTMEAALSWFFYLCAKHPEVQRRILDEATGAPDADAAPYTQAAFHEALRLYPPIPVIARTAVEDVELEGVPVAAGSGVLCAIRSAQRDRRFWPDADAFRPERFLDRGAQDSPAYFAFGAGPRHCIGERLAVSEAVIVVRALLQHVRLDLEHGWEPATRTTIAMKPEPGLRLILSPRDQPLWKDARVAS